MGQDTLAIPEFILVYPSTQQKSRIVVIGPLPPPYAGTSVSFKLFYEYLLLHPDSFDVDIINSAPKEVGQRSLLNMDNLLTAGRILGALLVRIRRADQVILFGNDQFLVSLMPLCLGIARVMRKPFYVRVFGGSLNNYYLGLKAPVRRYFHWTISHTDGLIVQTRELTNFFTRTFGDRVHHVPGYRLMNERASFVRSARIPQQVLKLVYAGHIREEKGVFDLLESMRLLDGDSSSVIDCVFYGPIYPEATERFTREIAACGSVSYGGILQPEKVVSTISKFDVFVFPSYYKGEGHPGVLIEAMMSGLPIITTRHNAIPELISHRSNGLLVTPRKPSELAEAIRLLFNDAELLANLAEQSMQSSHQYSSVQVIPQILSAMGNPVNELTNQG